MRLAVIAGRYPQWSERFVSREAQALADLGHEVTVWPAESEGAWLTPGGRPVAGGGGSSPRVGAGPAFCGFAALRFLAGCGWLQARRWPAVRRAAQGFAGRPDVVLAQFAALPAVMGGALARGWGVPLCVYVHAHDVWRPWRPGLRAVAKAERVFGCNRAALDQFIRLAPNPAAQAERSFLLYHGLPEECFARPRGLPVPGRIAAGGRLVEKKGFSLLLDAFARLRRLRPAVSLHLFGDGPLRELLLAQAKLLALNEPQFKFSPRLERPQLCAALAEAELLVAPCLVAADGDRDGVPNLILEAMALGVPAVAGLAGGVAEAVHPGETGWQVEPLTAENLAATLGEALADPAEIRRRGSNARELVRTDFALPACARRLETALREVHNE